jgi:hypothetical protein
MWIHRINNITTIPYLKFDSTVLQDFWLQFTLDSEFLSYSQLQALSYGNYMSNSIDTFKPLKLYDNSPSNLNGVLKTMLDLKRDFSNKSQQRFIFVTDIAFYKMWWQSYAFLEDLNRFGKLF